MILRYGEIFRWEIWLVRWHAATVLPPVNNDDIIVGGMSCQMSAKC